MSRFGRLEFEPRETRTADSRPREGANPPARLGHEHSEAPPEHQLQSRSAARELEPARDERHWLRAATEERRVGRHEAALRYYSRALEVDKSLVAGWVGQVQMLIALGEHPEAEVWSRKALELFRNNADLLAGRAQALCRAGDMKSAQASCDAAIGQPGLNGYPWTVRGELMLAKRQDTAEYCFAKAMQFDPDWLVTLEVALVYLHYGRPAVAHARAREALERAPQSPYCWYCQGECELALGLSGAASRSFARCVELSPGHAGATGRLSELANAPRPLRQFFRRLLRRR